jgi:hypothetical protein
MNCCVAYYDTYEHISVKIKSTDFQDLMIVF